MMVLNFGTTNHYKIIKTRFKNEAIFLVRFLEGLGDGFGILLGRVLGGKIEEKRVRREVERGKRGTVKKIPFNKARNINWVFTGAFKFINEKSIDKCCRNKGKCFESRTSCFRAVYYKKYIQDLGLNYKSERAGASWTLGAAICNENNCLKNFGRKSCLWSSKGCL